MTSANEEVFLPGIAYYRVATAPFGDLLNFDLLTLFEFARDIEGKQEMI
jgi:hypothetical protein